MKQGIFIDKKHIKNSFLLEIYFLYKSYKKKVLVKTFGIIDRREGE